MIKLYDAGTNVFIEYKSRKVRYIIKSPVIDFAGNGKRQKSKSFPNVSIGNPEKYTSLHVDMIKLYLE